MTSSAYPSLSRPFSTRARPRALCAATLFGLVRHGPLQQTDGPFVIQVQLREPGNRAIQLAFSDKQHEPIGQGQQLPIGVISLLESFECRR